MKYLILLAMIIPAGIYGQTLTTSPNFSMTTGTTLVSETLKYDTVPCIMLVTDTANTFYSPPKAIKDTSMLQVVLANAYSKMRYSTKNGDAFIVDYVWQINGYEVSHKEGQANIYYSDHGILNKQQGIVHDIYLDDKKQPLKLFVWMRKEIKQ